MPNPITILKRHLKIRENRRRIQASATDARPTVIVYQMGKVASSSIYHSLQKYPDACHGFHTHILNPDRIRARDHGNKHPLLNPDKRNRRSHDLSRYIIEPRHPAKIITLVRDPFARNISAFFENSASIAAAPTDQDAAMEYLQKAFLAETNLSHADYWFKEEFNRALGLDIFAHEYDPARGWCRFSSAPYDVLVLDTSLPDEEKSRCISEFVGIPEFQLDRHNTNPPGGRLELYQAFKAYIRLPKSVVDEVLNTCYSEHFFEEKTRQAFREQWQAPNPPEPCDR